MTTTPPPRDPPPGDEGTAAGGAPPPPPPPPGPGPVPAQPPPAYGAPPVPTDSFGHPLAEWWKRLVAIVIDNVVLGIPAFIVFIVLVAGAASQTETDPVTGEITKGGGGLVAAAVLGYAIMLILPFIYFTIMNGSRRGQTFGKMLLKIQVRDAATGGPLGMGKAFLRYLIATILGVFTCGLGGILNGLWPLWDDKRQALHDKVATSVVVDTG